MSWQLKVLGLERLQRAIHDLQESVSRSGGLNRIAYRIVSLAYGKAVDYSHVLTGTMRAAHRKVALGQAHFELALAPDITNPKTGGKPVEYGTYEHNRGGSHAFYERVYAERDRIVKQAIEEEIRL